MSTLTLPNGTALTQVTRASCLARIAAIPLYSFMYSQTTISSVTDRRADCTGLVSKVWATPYTGPGIYLHGYNTGSFFTQKVIERIEWADLRPGDAVGYFAANSPGNGGHAAIWMGGDKRPDGTLDVWDHGSGWGPKRRLVKWNGTPESWLAPRRPDGTPGLAPWRYVGIIEGGDMFCKQGDKGPVVEAMQRLCLVAGATLPRFGPDADYGAETVAALRSLTGGDGTVYGPVQYVALLQRAMRGAVGPAGPVGPRGLVGPEGPPGPGLEPGTSIQATITVDATS